MSSLGLFNFKSIVNATIINFIYCKLTKPSETLDYLPVLYTPTKKKKENYALSLSQQNRLYDI